ncbi:transporter substrate-binding domain-containing protein [Azospirillum sp. B21]|uniref:transporter substrate-binding domain-containing protein n=1 Tax=Azospirillum sp. B21 TaxID=2607496 RepID=UPI0011EC2BA5|nr:transporter substrate-binding domain-containing protein [Azospirillum sp. B21]KAA0573332.1 transporter substrate-binding domain-containing protein [Azospirillum sp. B21]
MNKPAIIAAGVALIASIAFGSVSLAKPEPQRLRIATEGAFAPWNATDPAGRLVGFEVDLAHDLCRRMAVECEVVAQDWDGILPGLQQGKYDAVMAGVSITADRAKVVDFSGAYAADPAVFAVRPGSDLTIPTVGRVDLSADRSDAVGLVAKSLNGKVVAVQTSTIHAKMMEAYFPGATVRTYDRLDHAALDLAAGRVDAMLGARSAVEAIGPTVKAAGPDFIRGALGSGVAVAVRKGDALSSRFSRAISDAAQDGTTAEMSRRWFGFNVSVE